MAPWYGLGTLRGRAGRSQSVSAQPQSCRRRADAGDPQNKKNPSTVKVRAAKLELGSRVGEKEPQKKIAIKRGLHFDFEDAEAVAPVGLLLSASAAAVVAVAETPAAPGTCSPVLGFAPNSASSASLARNTFDWM
jgi:hypothetical protein